MKNYNNLTPEAQNEIKSMIIDAINDGYLLDTYSCDMHHEVFNTDYFIIGRYEAKEWLNNNFGTFEAIDAISEYEKDNFGEIYTDLSEPERVVNMLVYIIGQELLNESETMRETWDNRLTQLDLNRIKYEIENDFATVW